MVFRVSDIGSDHKKHFIGQVALTAEDILTQCSTRTGVSWSQSIMWAALVLAAERPALGLTGACGFR